MLKNILNYTKVLICFAIFTLLLLSISYAIDFSEGTYTLPSSGSLNLVDTTDSLAGYTAGQIAQAWYNLYYNIDTSTGEINQTYLSTFTTMCQSIDNAGYDIISLWSYSPTGSGAGKNGYFIIFTENKFNFTLQYKQDSTSNLHRLYMSPLTNNISSSDYNVVTTNDTSKYRKLNIIPTSSDIKRTSYYTYDNDTGVFNYIIYCSTNILNSTSDSNNLSSWNGTYYYSISPPTPSYIPTNAEIAEKVQAFYDSDFFQNQSDFKDYFVLYNYNNETFSFIGHNLSNDIGQVIYRSNYPSNTTGVDYWSFWLRDLSTHIWNWFNNYYWLYTTTLDSETITYTGKGSVTDLLDLKFNPTYSTIVYSTIDYPCVIYGWDDDEGITVEQETIAGDFYTYDENIDPTTSEYNPITNYVLPNSIDTLLSNADTTSLFNLFVVPDFSNMEWILLVVGVFWSYFGGFVLLTCVLLFIYWVLRGV